MRSDRKQATQPEGHKTTDAPLVRLSESVLSVEQIREVDRIAVEEFGMHSLVLMENAALGCVHWLATRFARPRTAILCGVGNNGGDGLAIARHLCVMGWDCTVVLCGDSGRLTPDAARNLTILRHDEASLDLRAIKTGDDIESTNVRPMMTGCELIVDCLLGTGARGAPRSPMDRLIRIANDSPGQRIAIDIPTGVDAETGAIAGEAFLPAATLTFVARKPAIAKRNELFGEVCVLPIGIPVALIKRVLREQD